MKEKISQHAKKHRLFYVISAILLTFVIIAVTLNYHSLIAERKSFYTATLERESLSELNLYQAGSTTLVKQYFNQALATMTNIAANQDVQQELKTNQTVALQSLITQQRTISTQFNTLAVVSNKGLLTAFNTDDTDPAPPLGTDESKISTYKQSMTASGPFFVNAHISIFHRLVFDIVAPIHDKNGNYMGMVTGVITLPNLAKHIQLSSSYNNNFTALLTDEAGNSLVWRDQATTTLNNVMNKEPIIRALNNQQTVPANEEFNFIQEDCFSQGTTISFGSAGNLYLVSFYNIAAYHQQVAAATQDISQTYSSFIVRDGLLLLASFIIMAWVIHIHEKHRS